jgi:hypothetical protein
MESVDFMRMHESKQFHNPQPKDPNYRDEAYKRFIRRKACLISDCAKFHPDPHHESFGNKGMSYKPPDTYCLPLCREHHREREQLGYHRFWNKHCIKPEMACIRLLTEYIEKLSGMGVGG